MKLTKKEIHLLWNARWAALKKIVEEKPKDTEGMFVRVREIQSLLKALHRILKHPPKDLYPDPFDFGSKVSTAEVLYPKEILETANKPKPSA